IETKAGHVRVATNTTTTTATTQSLDAAGNGPHHATPDDCETPHLGVTMRLRVFAAFAALTLGALTACGGAGGGGTSANATLRIMAPAASGGGWDQTSRVAEQAIKAAVPDCKVEVFNVPGAGGTIGLAQLAGEK